MTEEQREQLRRHYHPTQSNRTFTFSAEDYGAVTATIREPNMATLEAAKLNYLHKKILERYLQNPSSEDEDMLKLMDLQVTRVAATYQALGQQEHPIYVRDRWLSEAAARLTDEGYWTWVGKQINNKPMYRFTGDAITEVIHLQYNESLSRDPTGPEIREPLYEGDIRAQPGPFDLLQVAPPPPPPRPTMPDPFDQFDFRAGTVAATNVSL